MERHFEKELKRIRTALEKMARLSQEMLESSTQAYLLRDRALAEKAFANEREVNNLEIDIDQMVEGVFALHQPVAVDLRFLLAILKINNDLERAGDHCVNIAQSAITCAVGPEGLPELALPRMITLANAMLRDACQSFFTKDLQVARTVLESDDSLDELNRTNIREAIGMVKSGDLPLESAMELLRISRNLERIGDLSTNVAEEVIFHVKAKVVKHHHDEPDDEPELHPAGGGSPGV